MYFGRVKKNPGLAFVVAESRSTQFGIQVTRVLRLSTHGRVFAMLAGLTPPCWRDRDNDNRILEALAKVPQALGELPPADCPVLARELSASRANSQL